ncbi:11S globulin seed storage protein Ana o 2.0101-like [Rhododendron vialii]|uniref:11S globulin seed storage protein Ana o 2.0101-like n=1 Tax=Rhododendron vialii TaxID=182163 RepID=UPI00265F9FE5|nr:11S globulin seed storage protein Ana o 2.0101-like [Rhododendron vialii]
MASPSPLLTFTLYLVLCTASSLAAETSQDYQQQQQQPRAQQRGARRQGDCQIQNLNTLEPNRQMQHEAGVSEIWDQDDDQLQCAGVAASRHVIEPRGLLLPAFVNAPLLAYVLQAFPQGKAYLGVHTRDVRRPTNHSNNLNEAKDDNPRGTQHQKLVHFRRGDILAQPAGVAHWVYNDGGDQLVLVVIHDTNNHQNQLDQNLRDRGNPQEQQQQQRSFRGQEQWSGNNIFQGFDPQTLAEAFGVDEETSRRLQSNNDRRGFIVRVEKEFDVVRPPRYEEEEEEREREYRRVNGLEETICTAKIKENIDDPERADIYTARAGRIRTLNSQNLPILRNLQLSAKRAVLYRNGMVGPYWNINAHSVMYVTRGRGRVQIVGSSNDRPVFDGDVREGQLLVIPQNYAVVKLAGAEGLEWFSVQTNGLAKTSPLSGRTSVIRAIPADILANAYRISREEARRVKFNRDEEAAIHTQRRGSGEQRRATANWAKNALLEVISKFE